MKLNSGSLRYFCCIKNGTTPASARSEYWDGNIKWVTPEDLGKLMSDKIINTKRLITEKAVEECNLPILPEGSVIISTRAPIGHMAINESPMSFNQGCRGIIPGHQVYGPFLYYMLKSRVCELNAMANGTTFVELSRDELAAVSVEFPPLDTQRRIAQFLDEKTARIDTLIEKKRELLDRLAEKRQALITRAVTKGLNPDVPMKSSGIDWLGDIPAHWEMRRLNSFCEFQSGKAHESFIEIDGQYVCVNARFISTNGTASKRCSKNLTPARPGDILMVMSDLPNGRALARSFLVDARDQYAVNQRVCRIRPQYGSCAYFSFQLDRNPQLLKQDDGKEQTHLSNSNFKLLSLLVPPETEQRNIVDHLNEVSSSISEASVKVEESANRLEEYRSALITAAVTGNIPKLI